MKKSILLSFLLSFILMIGIHAQSLVLYDGDAALENGAEIVFSGTPDVNPAELELLVMNTGESSLDVKVRRTDLSLVDSTNASFCWGIACYPPFTIVSPDAQTIGAGESNSSFRADYTHYGISGVSRVQYSFFDERNMADSTWIIVQFEVAAPSSTPSLQLTYKDEVVVNDQEILVMIDPEDGPGEVWLVVKNINVNPIGVMVRKYDVSLLDSTSVSFCWNGTCYSPNTYISPEAMRIESQTSIDEFHGDYYHNSKQGTSKARFTFFDENNPSDSTSILITYTVGHLGIDDNAKAGVSISNVYPNPATTASYVDYKLPKSVMNASIRVSNLLGVTVMEVPLNRNEGKATINVSNLNEGIYFYSLIVNNSATHTRKFVVKR